MCEAKEKIERLRALDSKPRKTEPRKKRHGAKTRITNQRRSHNTKRSVIDSKLGRSAMSAYPVMITGPEICRYESAELQQLCRIRSAIRQKEKTVGNKKKGRGWYFTQDGTAHPSPVHKSSFSKRWGNFLYVRECTYPLLLDQVCLQANPVRLACKLTSHNDQRALPILQYIMAVHNDSAGLLWQLQTSISSNRKRCMET